MPLILISAQLVFVRQTLWLPRRLANRLIDPKRLEAYLRRGLPAMRKMQMLVKPGFSG